MLETLKMLTAGSKSGKTAVPVLYLITELSVDGAQKALLNLLSRINRERFTPTVGCLYNGDGSVAHELRMINIPVFDAQMHRKADLAALIRLHNWVNDKRPTILHTHLFHANFPGRLIGEKLAVPIIINMEHTMAMESEWRYRPNRWTISRVDRVVAVSKKIGGFCTTHVRLPAKKVSIIYNGVEIPSLPQNARQQSRLELGLPEDALVCGVVGRLDPAKGVEHLIKAFNTLRHTHDSHLIIIGEGTEQQRLEAITNSTLPADKIHWNGFHADVVKLLPAFDISVQLSLHEGMAMTTLEAMAVGLSVVATGVGCMPELVINGKTGLLVPPGNPAALADAITALLENPEARGNMGRANRQRVQQHFTVKEMVHKTEQLYEELLLEKGLS